jgi:toxin YoeB
MKLTFSTQAWEQYLYWQTTDKKILKRIKDEHRIVYKHQNDTILIAQLRYHYGI